MIIPEHKGALALLVQPRACQRMSIASKHSYRFQYLKSEQWSNVRIEALAREKGHCQICGEESISNDAHHVWYPENIYETRVDHLVILCRPCHEFLHIITPECKTRDEEFGKSQWMKFRNAIVTWRQEKAALFGTIENIPTVGPSALHEEVRKIKQVLMGKATSNKLMTRREIGDLFSPLTILMSRK